MVKIAQLFQEKIKINGQTTDALWVRWAINRKHSFLAPWGITLFMLWNWK